MKILVLGSNGQLGLCLKDQLSKTDYDVIYTSRQEIDISDFKKTSDTISKIAPDLIINSSAYTSVDKSEVEEGLANTINNLAVENIANTCSNLNIWLIHFSTDYVFDGTSNLPYKENDFTNPLCVYGKTKLKGEHSIKSSKCKYLIIRTSWVYSEYKNNFLKTMIRLGLTKDELTIVSDQIGCPTYAQDIAKTVVKIIPQLIKTNICGIYHYCGNYRYSWHEFAQKIFQQAQLNGFKIPKKINKIQTKFYPTPAVRPLFSVLDCSKIISDFDTNTSNIDDGIKKVVASLACNQSI